MKIQIILLGILLGSFCGIGHTQTPTHTAIDYVGDGDPRHKMDVYIPEGITQPTATIVFVHGGGWRKGSKEATMRHCQELYEADYIVVGINYRLSQDSVFPAQIYDCKAAIRYLKSNASTYFIDTCNIGVTGTSAGGHLVALLGTTTGDSKLEGLHLGNPGVSSDVHAVADFFGPTNFLLMDARVPSSCKEPMIHSVKDSPESLLLGCLISTCPQKVAMANPIHYIDDNEPPFRIYHGEQDCLVSPHQSQLLHDGLKINKQESELILYADGGHGDFIDASVRQDMVEFFDQVLINTCN